MSAEHIESLEKRIQELLTEVETWKKIADPCTPLPNEKLVPYHSTEWGELCAQGWTTWFVRDDGIAQMIPPRAP